MRRLVPAGLIAILVLLLTSSAMAQGGRPRTLVVQVPATTDIQLAAMPDGTERWGDVAPTNSPVEVDLRALKNPRALLFDAVGEIAFNATTPPFNADGYDQSPQNVWGYYHVDYIAARLGSLVGVFLNTNNPEPGVTGVGLVFWDLGFSRLRPGLNGTFFIGDGWTADPKWGGIQQVFYVPSGANRLYLGINSTGAGAFLGGLTVSITPVY